MAAPALIPIVKKVAVTIVTDKNVQKAILGIILGVIVIIVMPIMALLGIFTGRLDISLDNIDKILEQQQAVAESNMAAIESEMSEQGYSAQRIEEAQALYMLVLFNMSDNDGFVDDYVSCFKPEQSDREFIATVNIKFGTNITVTQFTDAVGDIREKYKETEETENE